MSELDESRSASQNERVSLEEEVRLGKKELRERKAEVSRLKCRVRRLDPDHFALREWNANSPVCRFDGRLSRAVENAVEATEVSSNVLEVKDGHGVINDWARETIAELTAIDDIPANSSFRVFETCVTKAGKEVRGSWDRRTVPRVMHEVTLAAEMLIVERFLESIGSLSTSQE